MQQVRYDTFTARTWKKDSNGYLTVQAQPSRAGVLQYRAADGTKWGELRHPDEVFKKDSLDTLKLKPFTFTHPEGLLDTKNTKKKMNGVVGENVRQDGNYVACDLTIYDAGAIDSILIDRKLELSAGYSADIMDEEGIYEGEPYQKKQTNIRYNHVASVQRGRAGQGCSIRLDSNSALHDTGETQKSQQGDKIMKVIKREVQAVVIGDFRLDSAIIEIPEEHQTQIEALFSREKKMLEALTTGRERLDSQQAKMDGLTSDIKKVKKEAENTVSQERLDALVTERAEIINMAKESGIEMPKEGTFEEINKKVKKEILMKTGKWTEEKLDSSDAYQDAAWDQVKTDWDHQKKVFASRDNLKNTSSYNVNKDGSVDFINKAARGA